MEIKILNERPSNMSFDDYKMFLKIQKKLLKHRSNGKIVFLSKLHPSKEVIKELQESKMMNTLGQLIFKGVTYRKTDQQ